MPSTLYERKDTLPSLFPDLRGGKRGRTSDSEDSEEPSSPTRTPKKKRAITQQPTTLKQKTAQGIIGSHSFLTKRHKADGAVSKQAEKNVFITVGEHTAHIPSVHKVYGRLCEASLCSFRVGSMRMAVCDCAGEANHTSLTKGEHKLPLKSGPLHSSWAKVQTLTKAALKAASKK